MLNYKNFVCRGCYFTFAYYEHLMYEQVIVGSQITKQHEERFYTLLQMKSFMVQRYNKHDMRIKLYYEPQFVSNSLINELHVLL